MIATRTTRGSSAMAVLGWMLWVPAACLILLWILAAMTPADAGNVILWIFVAMVVPADAARLIVSYLGVMAMPFLIVGLLLARRKNVWKCPTCGHILDRA